MLTKHALCAADPTRLFWDKFKTATENRCWRYTQAPLALHLSIGPSFQAFQDYCGIVRNMTVQAYFHMKLWLSHQDHTAQKPSASFVCAASIVATLQRFFAQQRNRSGIPTKISVPFSINTKITLGARAAAKTRAQGLPKCKTSSG